MDGNRNPSEKVIPMAELSKLSRKLKAEGRKVVSTNGCFDLLHWGHMKYLHEARRLGDILICGLNSDESVTGLKGPSRPVLEQKFRALQLASLESIDYVVIFDEATPERFIRLAEPDVHVKGGDYRGMEIPEKKLMTVLGGKLAFVDMVEGLSTTGVIKKLKLLPD